MATAKELISNTPFMLRGRAVTSNTFVRPSRTFLHLLIRAVFVVRICLSDLQSTIVAPSVSSSGRVTISKAQIPFIFRSRSVQIGDFQMT